VGGAAGPGTEPPFDGSRATSGSGPGGFPPFGGLLPAPLCRMQVVGVLVGGLGGLGWGFIAKAKAAYGLGCIYHLVRAVCA
jgi:hypothetical protein